MTRIGGALGIEEYSGGPDALSPRMCDQQNDDCHGLEHTIHQVEVARSM